MRSLNEGVRHPVLCQGNELGFLTTQLDRGKVGVKVNRRARGSRLYPGPAGPTTCNRYWLFSMRPGMNPAHVSSPRLCNGPVGSVTCQLLKSPMTRISDARGAHTRKFTPPVPTVAPSGKAVAF